MCVCVSNYIFVFFTFLNCLHLFHNEIQGDIPKSSCDLRNLVGFFPCEYIYFPATKLSIQKMTFPYNWLLLYSSVFNEKFHYRLISLLGIMEVHAEMAFLPTWLVRNIV